MPRIVHFEMHVDDTHRAQKFYSNVFGWEFSKWDGPADYWLIKTGDTSQPGIDGGMLKRRDPAGAVYNTLSVDNLDNYIKKVCEHGGEIVVPKMPVPGVGWLAYLKDPEGNVFGMMQADLEAS